jgi:hypothetical protein
MAKSKPAAHGSAPVEARWPKPSVAADVAVAIAAAAKQGERRPAAAASRCAGDPAGGGGIACGIAN